MICPDIAGVDTDSSGNIYVLTGDAVLEYTSEGVPVRSSSFTGVEGNSGIAVDPRSGDVWISTAHDRLVRVNAELDTVGLSLASVSERPDLPPDRSTTFQTPRGLAFDCPGKLIVADYGHNRVVRLSLPDAPRPRCAIDSPRHPDCPQSRAVTPTPVADAHSTSIKQHGSS
jgi:hypothetical protein